ncbi:glycerol-3-phosphate dehydrogenase [Sphingosinicella sp. LHD-64]|uniref:glycerol-3-phosphate dehydrogenase n=1 Tax=Sphingosinicella sp. LHD-64 TaxID=3072139 RepID=UPI00280C4D31|nr:glycerol-3-phosphate dehydrogenase [Sphingosinicella sp. LHD-64]MDQ8757314.1 glycerol-3-phosphate dehydrogenase [Sphingosinicella sp. LHD-64]
MDSFDLLVVGGGINGAAIARDAAGRGLSVLLVEKDDLASHTSSASSKLIHGGLRYLEQYDFRLVRESLHEREVMLRTAPHLVRPLRFVLPHPRTGRPWWMVRAGLLLYDLLAGRKSLPGSRGLRRDDPAARPLKPGFRLMSYWDAWVDDARLVILNAIDAHERGAEIATRTEFLAARREGDAWIAGLSGGRQVRAGMIVNAAGPWVAEVLNQRLAGDAAAEVRLVKGSHIAVPRLHDGDQAYILQQPDGRIVFALPFGELTLIGTTDTPVAAPEDTAITAEEIAYLCVAANGYFAQETTPADVVWSYAGIRALHDDGAAEASQVTREYRLELDPAPGAKLLSVFGGKLTTARHLAIEALDKLGVGGLKFTATSALPGGHIMPGFNAWLDELAAWMPAPMLDRLARAYGTRLDRVLDRVESLRDMGRYFGADLYEAEVHYLMTHEWARTAEDILWRRTKLGLKLTAAEHKALATWVERAAGTERRSGDTPTGA